MGRTAGLLLQPPQCRLDVARGVDLDQQRQAPGDGFGERREFGRKGRRAVGRRARGVGRVDAGIERGVGPELVQLLALLLGRFVDVLALAAVPGAAPRRARPVQHHAPEAGRHLLGRVAEEVDERRRARHEPALRHREHRRHALGAVDRQERARRVHRRQRLHVRRHVADVALVARLGERADFLEPELRAGVDEARVHGEPGALDARGAGRNGQISADGRDAPVGADEDGGALQPCARHGLDGRVHDGERAALRLGLLGGGGHRDEQGGEQRETAHGREGSRHRESGHEGAGHRTPSRQDSPSSVRSSTSSTGRSAST